MNAKEPQKEEPQVISDRKLTRSTDLQPSTASLDTNAKLNVAQPAPQPDEQSSFEALLHNALEEKFSSQTPRVRDWRSPTAGGPDQNRESQGRASEVMAAAPVKPAFHDPLPLILSFSMLIATPKGTGNDSKSSLASQRNVMEGSAGDDASAIDRKEDADPEPKLNGETAFSARIKVPDQPAFEIPQSNPKALATPVGSALAEADARKSDAPTLTGQTYLQSQTAVTMSATPNPAGISSGAISKELPAVKAPAAISEIPAAPLSAPAPLKEMSIQVPGARGVEVKLTETAGQVRVDVRSTDVGLNQDLRVSLHELVNSLEKKGFSTEISHPIEATTTRLNETGASKESNAESKGDASGRHEQERQQQERQRQQDPSFDGRSQKARATAWNDAIDPHLEKRSL